MPSDLQLVSAALLVALTSADEKKATASAAVSRQSSLPILQACESDVEKYWDSAVKESLSFLSLVLKNNNTKDPKLVLARADVQEALRYPFIEAAQLSADRIEVAVASSAADALQKSKGEVKLLGLGWTIPDPELVHDVTAQVKDDLMRNAKAMRTRITKALLSGADTREAALARVSSDAPRRAKYSAHAAVWSAPGAMRALVAEAFGINRIWVSRLDSKTCSSCKLLHGTIVKHGKPFPDPPGVQVYAPPLLGPPLHPWCRCVIVLTLLKPTD